MNEWVNVEEKEGEGGRSSMGNVEERNKRAFVIWDF